jgi:ferritin-like metal-binding protein YciE
MLLAFALTPWHPEKFRLYQKKISSTMKKSISTLQEALLYLLQGLWYTETTLIQEFKEYSNHLSSPQVKSAVLQYIDNADTNLLRLERVFNHLTTEPVPRKNEVIVAMMRETRDLLTATTDEHLRDILMIGCVQYINAYKEASYKAACLFIVEMELDGASDIIQHIWQSEHQTCQAFASLSIHEFNKANGS